MTPEKILELEQIQEKLVDVVLREADPASWTRDTDAKTLGIRLNEKRSAAATLTLINKIGAMLNYVRGKGPPPPEDADEMVAAGVEREPSDNETKAAADAAAKLLKEYRDRADPAK